MLDIRRIDDRVSVAPQIAPEDIAAIKAAGFVAIVNNRPDGEEGGQPTGDAIRAPPRITASPIPPFPSRTPASRCRRSAR